MIKYMQEAYQEAIKAYRIQEVPVGAVIVQNDIIIARGHNTKIKELDITGHAEIQVLKLAAKKLGRTNLNDCIIYITLEPCSMCLSAILQSNIKNIYFGAYDKTMGAVESCMKITEFPLSNKVKTVGGILEFKCSIILKRFFKEIRN